jgi:DNA-binding beta-propeller fold protein YncE
MKPKQLSFLFVVNALLGITAAAVFPAMSREAAPDARRTLYAVSQLRADRGSISVYDIDAGHHLIKTIPTVPNVGGGVAVSAATGKLYVAYRDGTGIGKVYCLNVYDNTILWDKPFNPGVDRLEHFQIQSP